MTVLFPPEYRPYKLGGAMDDGFFTLGLPLFEDDDGKGSCC